MQAELPTIAGRSLTGARIETSSARARSKAEAVALSRERGSKRFLRAISRALRRSLSHGSADRNVGNNESDFNGDWSLSHGSADRNGIAVVIDDGGVVALSRERGSKRDPTCGRCARAGSLSHGSADRNVFRAERAASNLVALSRERGSKPDTAVGTGAAMVSLSHGSADRNINRVASQFR